MPQAIKKGDPASCGDPCTGSTNVFINGQGATRVGVDTAGGIIEGPGAVTVFINGAPASLPGDAIVGHGLPPHSGPVTVPSPSTTVFIE
jgi:uncharacterized Zn-binding protein involved in type VI secretion